MNTIGKLLYRSTVILCLVVMAIAVPSSSVSAAYPTEDFNNCALPAGWIDETNTDFDHPGPTIVGAGSNSNASVQIEAAAGHRATISGSDRNAPRIMRAISDTSFDLEVRFNSALHLTVSDDQFAIQGILVRDARDPANPKYLRFDLDTDDDTINYYVGFNPPSGSLVNYTGTSGTGGVASLGTVDAEVAGWRLRLVYDQPAQTWSLYYYVPSTGWASKAFTFSESAPPRGGAIDFTPTHIGVFAGSRGNTPPGHIAQIDYIWTYPVNEAIEDVTFFCADTLDEVIYLPLVTR